jgi:hypothetical protein
VWHAGILYKLRQALPLNYFLFLNSYLHSRHFLVKVWNDYSELTFINAGVPRGSVLGPLLYLLYTADLPTSPGTLTASNCLATWRMKVNETKSTHVTFTTRRATCPPVHINDVQLPQSGDVKYLGLHLDRRRTWHKHIFTKRNNSALPSPKCIGCSDASPNSPSPTNYSSIKQYSNPSGPTVYNSGALLHLQHQNPGKIPI